MMFQQQRENRIHGSLKKGRHAWYALSRCVHNNRPVQHEGFVLVMYSVKGCLLVPSTPLLYCTARGLWTCTVQCWGLCTCTVHRSTCTVQHEGCVHLYWTALRIVYLYCTVLRVVYYTVLVLFYAKGCVPMWKLKKYRLIKARIKSTFTEYSVFVNSLWSNFANSIFV